MTSEARPLAPVVVVISADPRASHRAGEAMRIGLGVAASDNDVALVLTGPAAHLLDADTGELVDGDDVAKFRAGLKRLDVPFHVERLALVAGPDWTPDRPRVVPLSPDELAALVARGRRVVVF